MHAHFCAALCAFLCSLHRSSHLLHRCKIPFSARKQNSTSIRRWNSTTTSTVQLQNYMAAIQGRWQKGYHTGNLTHVWLLFLNIEFCLLNMFSNLSVLLPGLKAVGSYSAEEMAQRVRKKATLPAPWSHLGPQSFFLQPNFTFENVLMYPQSHSWLYYN